MNKEFNLGFTLGILFVLILISSFVLIFNLIDNQKLMGEEIVNVTLDCSNKSITKASNCALSYVKTIYQYNESNIGKDLDLNKLISEGGVCSSWSKLYSEIGDELKFNTEEVTIKINSTTSHRFTIWANRDAYCLLD